MEPKNLKMTANYKNCDTNLFNSRHEIETPIPTTSLTDDRYYVDKQRDDTTIIHELFLLQM
jgi:hypothetical protein